ncbi:hypothetical protein AVEN_268315-1 [Araneus ventricosus]|uniref:Uncharacterized protein n=1 Tax=Araneus ventricosus TaxID=182803 RepID=A0A4Y1ZTZ2_ARAVE|nr:hypothetical protein AVEN_268315-1 [Araneus ventricosus]
MNGSYSATGNNNLPRKRGVWQEKMWPNTFGKGLRLKQTWKETILVEIGGQRAKRVLHSRPHLFISHFLFRSIKGDETRVRNFTPDTKSASMTWKHPKSPVTKKYVLRREGCADRDEKGVIWIDFFASGTTSAARYCDTVTKLMSVIRRKRPGVWSRGVLFLDDMQSLGADFYQDGLLKLISRYDKCINVGGEYVEK